MSSAADRIEKGRQSPLSSAEQAFFGVPDDVAKPVGNVRVGISPAVSETALRTVMRNHPDVPTQPGLVEDVIRAARQITPDAMRVHPDVRDRLKYALMDDPRFNGTYGNGIGYSEFITRALDALGCPR